MSNIKNKITVTHKTGYACANCGFENEVQGDAPTFVLLCANCASGEMKKLWKNKVTTITKIEPIE